MKILLCCLAGVTSTLFSSKLKDAASRKRVDATIWSASEIAVEYSIDLADVVLIEPQLKGSFEKIKNAHPDKKVILIKDEDFVNFNAQKIFDDCLEAIKE
jgi:Phosphotransferase system cellobiose-specific component IIB